VGIQGGLDYEVRSPKFNVKRPDGKTHEEIVAEVERKVVPMIGNYTHKEWECAQKILKHQGRVNRVFDEMNVSFSLRPIPSTTSKKMLPTRNVGSEPAKILRKGNLARRQPRQRAPQKVRKLLAFWHSKRLKLPKPPCPLSLKRRPN
jgi:hypothetical protein